MRAEPPTRAGGPGHLRVSDGTGPLLQGGRQGPRSLEFASVGQGEEDSPCLWNISVPGTRRSGSPGRAEEQEGPWLWLWSCRGRLCFYERHAAARRGFLTTPPQTRLISPPTSHECLLCGHRTYSFYLL